MTCWHGYLSGVRCKWFAYGPADATATPSKMVQPLLPAYPGGPRKEAVRQVSVWYHRINIKLEMSANAQPDGRPAEHRWRPLFNAAVWLTPTIRVPCSNAAKTRNPLKLPGVPQTNEMISATSGPKFTILWGHVGEILLLNNFFSDCRYLP